MKKQILSSLKRILCIGLALNIIYTSVDFSALNVWAEEEITESAISGDSDTEISGDIEETIEIPKEEAENPTGEDVEENTDKTGTSDTQENQGNGVPMEGEESEKKGFFEGLKNLIAPFGLMPLSEDGDEGSTKVNEVVRIEGATFTATVSLDGTYASLKGSSVPVIVYMHGKTDEGNLPYYEGTLIFTENNKGTISDIPVYIKKGTGALPEGTGKYETPENFYEIELQKTISENREYTFAFEDETRTNSFVDLNININSLKWSGTSKEKLNATKRHSYDYEITTTFYTENPTEEFPFSPETIKLVSSYTLDETPCTMEYIPKVTPLGNGKFKLSYSGIAEEEGMELKLSIPSTTSDGSLSYVPYKKDVDGYQVIAENKIGFNSSTSDPINYEEYVNDLLFIQAETITGNIKWLDNEDKNHAEGNPSFRVKDETLKSYVSLYTVSTNTKITDFDYDKNVSVNQNATESEPAIKISSVPMYNTQGHLLNYYFKLEKEGSGNNEIPAVDSTNQHTFKIIYDNGVNSTITDFGYDEATVILTLAKNAEKFEFTINWLDDATKNPNSETHYNNPNNQARIAEMTHGVQLYLWRYAVTGSEKDAANAAPVYDENGNQYSLQLNSNDEKYVRDTITLTRGNFKKGATEDDFPFYNENGVPYVYYVTVVDSGSCYDVVFPTAENGEKNEYIQAGEALKLVRSGTDSLIASVDWRARGESDYQGACAILEVQRRLANSNADWQSISYVDEEEGKVEKTEKVTSSASSTRTDVVLMFSGLELYNEEGKTYEYRVIERGIHKKDQSDYIFETEKSNWTDLNTEKTSWENSTVDGNVGIGEEQIRFKYMNHGYKGKAVWENRFSYDEYTNQIYLGNNSYIVTNTLYDSILYTPEIQWNFGGLPGEAKTNAKLELDALLQGTQLSNSSYTTKNYAGQTVEYIVARNKQPYAKIVVTGKDGQAYYNYYLWDSQNQEWKTEKVLTDDLPISTKPIDSIKPINGNYMWVFDQGLVFEKYDEYGSRYAYSIGTMNDDGEFDSKEYCTEHTSPISEFIRDNNLLIRTEFEPTSSANHPIIRHTLAIVGVNYRLSVKVNWKDDLTDVASREVDAHIVALRKIGEEYYLYKDLGAIDADNADANKDYRFQLNVGNDFEGMRYYDPLDANQIATQNVVLEHKNPALQIDTSKAQKTDGTIDEKYYFEDDLYYTVIQYSFKIGEYTMVFPGIEEGEVLPKQYLLLHVDAYTTTMKYDTSHPENVYLYSYDASVTEKSSNVFNFGETRYHHKEFLNELNKIYTNVNVVVNWEDDSNTSGYRKDKLVVQLYQIIGDQESPVLDNNGKIKSIVWNTGEQENVINQYVYKANGTMSGSSNTTSNYNESESTQNGFKDLPLTTNDGKPINYTIRQYVVPNGENIYSDSSKGIIDSQYRINEGTTEKNAINNYYGRIIENLDSGANVEEDNYYQYFKIKVDNFAVNLNYKADFYIVWHDEDAYKSGARSDMKYALYYTFDGDTSESKVLTPYTRSDFNSVLDTADSGATNPFYQKLSFYGLTEFISGKRVHYYVQEIKTSSNTGYYQYRIDYYNKEGITFEELEEGNFIYANTGNQKHRQFLGNIEPDSTWIEGNQNVQDGYYIAQNQVVVNYLSSVLNVQGTKKWVNLARDAEKPDCNIYLFRTSIHDKTNEKPILAADMTQEALEEKYKQKKIADTQIDKEKNIYTFTEKLKEGSDAQPELTKFPKFDKYGASYTYTIGEIIHGMDGRAIAVEIMEGNSEGNMLLTNTYDKEGKNSRDIKIHKNWYLHEASDSKHNPVAKFYIYRMECNYIVKDDSNQEIFPDAENVEFEKIINNIQKPEGQRWDEYLKTICKLVHTTTLKYGSESEKIITGLNIYGPNGKPYVYFVVEDTGYVPSYIVSNSAKKSEDNNNDATYGYYLDENVVFVSNNNIGIKESNITESQVCYLNNLRENKFLKIQGIVEWREGDTKIGSTARPEINKNEAPAVNLEVYRYSNTQEDLGNKGNNFTSEKVKLAENAVTWELEENGNWKYSISGDFPQYALNGKPYYYFVRETLLFGQQASVNYGITSNDRGRIATDAKGDSDDNIVLKINNDNDSKNNIVNTLRGTYTVLKHWTDGYNSYGMRPNRVLVMFQYQEANSAEWKMLLDKDDKTIVLELNDENEWNEKSFTTFPFSTKEGQYYTYRAIEFALGYDKSEGTTNWIKTIDLDFIYEKNQENSKTGRCQFTPTIWNYGESNDLYKYDSREETDAITQKVNNSFRSVSTFASYRVYPGDVGGVTFGSNKQSHKITIENKLEASTGFTIAKHWVDDDHNTFNTRPEKVEIKLQQKQWTHTSNSDGTVSYTDIKEEFNNNSAWKDVAATTRFFITEKNAEPENSDTWVLKLENLPMYDEDGFRIAYRAFEVGDNKTVLDKISYNSSGVSSYTIDTPESMVMGNYYLSQYNLQSDPGVESSIHIDLYNTLKKDSSTGVSVNKDWIISGGDNTANTNQYQSTVQATLTYKNSEDQTTYDLVSKVDLKESEYNHTWNEIPACALQNNGTAEDPAYKTYDTLVNVDVKEIKTKLGTDASENEVDYTDHAVQSASDSAVIGTFTAGEQDWLVKNKKNGDSSFTITNTPLISHTLQVRYKEDQDAQEKYQTRPNHVYVKLQYKEGESGTWKDVDDTLKANLLDTVNYENIKIENADVTPETKGDPSYESAIEKLPQYRKTDADIVKYQYRIVESDVEYGSSKLNVPYVENSLELQPIKGRTNSADSENTDKTVAGYTYAYDNSDESITKLDKSIVLIGLKGSKVWDDQSNKFNTRPILRTDGEIQTGDSSVKITLKKGTDQTDVTANSTITWKDMGDDSWSYETNQVFPKYRTGTDNYETYSITETIKNNDDYTPFYGENLSSSTRNTINGNDFVFTDITNELQKKTLNVEKHWPDLTSVTGLNLAPVSVTYTVQQKVSGTNNSTYKTLLYSDSTPVTVILKYVDRGADGNVTNGSIPELPLCNSSGVAYEYRILETEAKVTFTDSVDVSPEVTYKLDLENNKIKEFIGTSTTASKEQVFNASVLNADTFTYQIGPFDAKYEKTDSVYKYINSIHTASASAEIEWSETKVGETALDATLVQKFRPDQVELLLQRKIKDGTTWEDVTNTYTNNTVISVQPITKDATVDHSKYTVSAITNLPIFIYDNNAVKEYEYRIVEKEFVYTDTTTKREISYTNGITSNFDTGKKFEGKDTVDGKSFYTCSNTNVTSNDSYDYETKIVNTLQTADLVDLVDATLTGTVLWKDNKNELQKRPDGSSQGINLQLRAQKGTANEYYTVDFVLGGTDVAVSGNRDITISNMKHKNGTVITAQVSWEKTDANWNYTITGLPLFDQNGNHITYSICSKNDPTNYIAKADSSFKGQNTDSNQKYAFGTVTDVSMDKANITNVDLVENMTTKLAVNKIWNGDEDHYWQTRPSSVHVAIQYRIVDKDGSAKTGSNWTLVDDTSFSPLASYPTTAKDWTTEFRGGKVVDSPGKYYILSKPADDGPAVTQWEYEAVLPQYRILDNGTYQLIEYRVVELAKATDGTIVLSDAIPEANPDRDTLPHIGSYYMSNYDLAWNNGFSTTTITNTIDSRQNITVKKKWQSNVQEADQKEIKVNLIGMIEDQDGHVTNVEHVFEHTLPITENEEKKWEFTYQDLPQYNLESQKVTWHVVEIVVDGKTVKDIETTNGTRVAAVVDGSWIGFYEEDTLTTGDRSFTITNIPSTSAKLTVTYTEDIENAYGTRFEETKAVLQYREKGNETWQPVKNTTENHNLADKIIQTTENGYITGTLSLENGEVVITQTNSSRGATYSYGIQNLPKYCDDTSIKELEYRLVEVKQGTNITVPYSTTPEHSQNTADITAINLAENAENDAVSAGYEYVYSTNASGQSDAKLTKKLKKVYIPGTKTWEDENNAYGTRPDTANGTASTTAGSYIQTEDSALKVTVKRGGSTFSPQPAITWKTENLEDANVWKYESSVLPKYMPNSDTVASYSTEEIYGNSQYTTEQSDFNLINKLKSKTITVNKVWHKDAATAEYDITFLLQSKIEDAAAFDTIPNYGTKVLLANASEKSVKWENLPSVTSDGKTIQYKVVEQTTNANFRTEEDSQTDTDGNITYTFTNIEEQTYTVIKKWIDLVDIGTAESSDHKFSAKGVLQQSVENGEWEDVADKTWEFSDGFEDLSSVNFEKTITFTNLPKYTKDGKSIKYQGIETYVNGNEVASQSMYKVEHVHNAEQQKSTITNTLDVIHVKVVKKDAVDQKPLKGAKFGLYAYNNNSGKLEESPRYEATSDETGVATFQVFIPSTYCLKEMEAPIGYAIATISDPIYLTKDDYNKTKEIIVEDPRKLGKLIIYKQDSKSTMDNPIPLNDVKFEVYKKQEGNFVQTMWWFLTGKQYVFQQEASIDYNKGYAKITDIPWGEYYIVETETNTGYVLSTDKYYFKVNAETVGHPIELWSIDTFVDSSKKIIDNTITNYKNKFYFQKKAVGTQNVLTGGTFEIHKASGEKVGESFTLNDTSPVEFEGFEVGEYYIKEVSAPTNYAKAEDLYFSITDIGEIKDASGQVIADQTLVMEDMPLCNFKVTKVFTGDATWKNSIRPSEVEIQLYAYRTDSNVSTKAAVGDPQKIEVNTTTNTYTCTFDNLPMYEVESGTAYALSYIAEEVPTGDTMYTVSYSTVSVQGGTAVAGCTYEETITNEIVATDVQNIFISKVNKGGPQDAEFDLQVTFWKVDTHKHFYIDSYDVGTWNDVTKDIDPEETKSIGQDGMLKIKHNQTVKFTLPKGVDYSVEEIFSENTTPEYKVEPGSFVPNDLGDNKQRISITNTKQVYTAINNTTENLDNTGSKQTNAGGTVAVIEYTNSSTITESADKVDYTSGKYCVHWAPKKDWENENTFTIKYKDTADGEEKEITVSEYLDEKGNLIPAYDESHVYLDKPCYEELYNRYRKFEIKQDLDTKEIYLYLSDEIQGMPYLNQVNVEFIPTIAVANITDGRVGGGVKIKASDFKPNSEGMLENQTDGRLSHKTRIYAQAEEGYYIDLRETELGLVGKVLTQDMMTKDAAGVGLLLTTYSLAEDMPLLADGTGANKITLNGDRFSKTLQYDSGSYTLTGTITVLERNAGNNPTYIVMEVDKLSIPIDIGIVFKKYVPKNPDSNSGATEDSISDATGKEETAKTISALTEKDGVAPKTGDDNSLYVWYLLFLMSLGYILNDFAKTRNKKDQ